MKVAPIKIFVVFLSLLIIFLYLYNLGNNPTGFFCDEALFGIRAKQILEGNFNEILSPLFNIHFRYVEGNLTFYPLIPFIGILGLNEFSVRFTSLFFTAVSLPIFYLSLKKLEVKNTFFPIITYVLSPFIIHISRIYITSLTPSIFVMLSAYYFYIRGQKEGRTTFFILSGLLFGVASYGYNAFIVSIILILLSIIISELLFTKWRLLHNKKIFLLIFSYAVICLPIVYNAFKNPQFFNRLKEKNQDFSDISSERIFGMVSKYFKYYDLNYLSVSGEQHFPSAFIQRHTVTNAGIYLKTTTLFISLSYVIFLVTKNKNKRYFAPLFILFLLHPIPDLISLPTTSPPYTIPLSSTILVLPFIIGYGIDYLLKPYAFLKLSLRKQKFFSLVFRSIMVISIIEGLYFLTYTYQKYPLYSSGYWGWQYGPKEIINYFINHSDKYDYMCMEGVFNEPQVFIKFYDFNDLCKGKCHICSPLDNYHFPNNTLYAVSSESFSEYSLSRSADINYEIEKIIYYPNGTPAFYLINQ